MTPEAISLVPSPSPMMLPGLSHPLHPSEHSVSPKPTPPGSHLLKVVPLFRGPQGQTPGYLLTPPPHSQSLPGPQLSSVTLSVPRVLAQDSSAPMWTPQPPPRPPGPQSAPTQPQRVAPRTDLAPLHRAPSPSTPQLALGGTVGLGQDPPSSLITSSNNYRANGFPQCSGSQSYFQFWKGPSPSLPSIPLPSPPIGPLESSPQPSRASPPRSPHFPLAPGAPQGTPGTC